MTKIKTVKTHNAALQRSAAERIKATINIYKENAESRWENIMKPSEEKLKFASEKYGQKYESYYDNQLYGKGILTRLVKGIPEEEELHTIIPHGMSISRCAWSKEIESGLPIACYSDFSFDKYTYITKKYKSECQPFLLAHPFIKLSKIIKMAKKRESSEIQGRVLYFPMHSTYSLQAPMHEEEKSIRELIQREQDEGKVVNLCIYFIDYLKLKKAGKWEDYKQRFNKVYCCGHRMEPAFLVNLCILLNEHEYIVSDGISSHTFFAAMMNKNGKVASQTKQSYGFKNSKGVKRMDKQARKIDINAHKNIHQLIEGQGYSIETARRYFINELNPDEEEKAQKVLRIKFPKNHYAFTQKYSMQNYPLIN